MRHILQPKGSWYCGHCSMAMVLDDTMDNVIVTMGTYYEKEKGGATISMKTAELDRRGVSYSVNNSVDNRRKIDLDGKGIVCIAKGRRFAHAMAFEGGKIYDPEGEVFESVKDMKRTYKGSRVYSVIKIEEEL